MSGQPCGLTLHFISGASGLGKSKIKMLLSRHKELQAPPYSARAGGARIYFQAFIEWLAQYEGKEAAEKLAQSQKSRGVTSVTRLPAGVQLRELRLLAEKGVLARDDVRRLLGLAEPVVARAPTEPLASPELAEKAFGEILHNLGTRPGLPPGTVEKVARAAAGAARNTLKAIEARAAVDAAQPRLLG